MRFSVAIPTCVEGLLYPVPFITPERLLRVATAAETMGYHSVWGNDHLTTQKYVKEAWPDPPNYYEPLIALAFVAGATKHIRLGTSIIVMPTREPVVLSKQVATLDQFSGGRVMLGIGVGAYREEFDAVNPDRKGANRGQMVEEGIQALQHLFTERVASYRGKYYHFESVECYPKPLQDPFPIYVGGNTLDAPRRAGTWGQGWLPAVLPPQQLRERVDILYRAAEQVGRNPACIDIAPQFSVRIGRTHEEALTCFRESGMYQHLVSLKKSTLKEVDLTNVEKYNLVGTPDEIGAKIQNYADIGVTHFCALIFGTASIDDTLEQMQFFREAVMSHFMN